LGDAPEIITLPLTHPVLDFAFVPGEAGTLAVALDTAWGMLKQNPSPTSGVEISHNPIPEETAELGKVLLSVKVEFGGKVRLSHLPR
jgi:hypothetical protein